MMLRISFFLLFLLANCAVKERAEVRLQWPLAGCVIWVSQKFSSSHEALDLVTKKESPVYPVAPGRIVGKLYTPRKIGHAVVVYHPQWGLYSLYGHLAEASPLQIGEEVQLDSVLGREGSSGIQIDIKTGLHDSRGHHLHLYFGGGKMISDRAFVAVDALDPLKYLSQTDSCAD